LNTPLSQLVSLDPRDTDALDLFVSTCLACGGVWESFRTSDGIAHIDRVFDRGPEGLGVCARIYEIADQTLHTFWLELERDVGGISWSLYFDPIGTSPRDHNVVPNHERADEVEWRATLTGEAVVVDGALFVVDGSTSASVLDVPDPPLPAPRHQRRRRRHR
jgi:hypothetical protein